MSPVQALCYVASRPKHEAPHELLGSGAGSGSAGSEGKATEQDCPCEEKLRLFPNERSPMSSTCQQVACWSLWEVVPYRGLSDGSDAGRFYFREAVVRWASGSLCYCSPHPCRAICVPIVPVLERPMRKADWCRGAEPFRLLGCSAFAVNAFQWVLTCENAHISHPLPYVHPHVFTLNLLISHCPFPSRPLTAV